jgi:penicillin-insensitive murein DD-endopeptidase
VRRAAPVLSLIACLVSWAGSAVAEPPPSTRETTPPGASLSVGLPHRGEIVGAASVCAWDGTVFHTYSCRRGISWGTQELVDLLVRVGRRFREQEPGYQMIVGNLSRRRGGEIRYSVSHQSGRDVDLGLILQAKGRQHLPLPLARIKPDGTGAEDGQVFRFDDARNWALVKELLAEPAVQWIFVADWLKQRMLDHARDRGEPLELLMRAEFVLHQPSSSSPHDDHYHVRVYCSEPSLLAGCRQGAPFWGWADGRSGRFEQRVDELLEWVRFGDRAQELEGLEQLTLFGRPEAAVHVIHAWPPADAALKAASLRYLRGIDRRPYVALLLDRAAQGLKHGWGEALMPLVVNAPPRLIDRFLEDAEQICEAPARARTRILRLAWNSSSPRALATLVGCWRGQSAELDRELRKTARAVLNRTFRTVRELAGYLKRHGHEDGLDLLLTSMKGVCRGGRLYPKALAAEILAGGGRREVAVRVLERLFPYRFSQRYSHRRLHQRWFTVLENYLHLGMAPCEAKVLRERIARGVRR